MMYLPSAPGAFSVVVTVDFSAWPPQGCRTWSMGEVPVVSVPAEVDVANKDSLRDALLDVCAIAKVVVVDMTATNFFDAGGTGVLFSIGQQLRNAGGELRLAATHPQVLKVLAVLNLARVVPIFSTLAAAAIGDERETRPLFPAA